MKWRAIEDAACQEVHAWTADAKGYYVAMYRIRDQKKFRAWFNGTPLHDGTFDSPKPAQKVCEDHFNQRKAA